MEEMLRMEEMEGDDCLRLRSLWEEVFWEDSRAFTDYYFEEKAVRNHAFALRVGREYAAMLYLSPYPMMLRAGERFVCREIYYIVGVATKKEYRHRGYMDRLLKKALAFARAKGQPFVFLMPADPQIYTPYQFSYIYDRRIYRLKEDQTEKSFLGIHPLEETEIHALAERASSFLEKHYDVFIRRDGSYYRGMERELWVQNGGISLIGDGEGYFFYTEEEGKGEILEAVLPEGDKECIVYDSGKTEPAIMARIADVSSMLSLLYAENEEIFLSLLVRDPLLQENEGVWKCHMTSGKVYTNKEEKDVLEKSGAWPEYECQADIGQLAAWIFGYQKEEECFLFPDAADKEAVLRKLRGIRRPCRVFINEIV